jgi:ATP-dependent Clp protease, protease subunit
LSFGEVKHVWILHANADYPDQLTLDPRLFNSWLDFWDNAPQIPKPLEKAMSDSPYSSAPFVAPFVAPFGKANDLHGNDADAKDKEGKEGQGSMMEGLSFKSRFVYVFGGINDKVARATCERLLLLAEASDKPINVLVSSPGGHVESGDAIHDMIKFVGIPVNTIGSGWVASAGTHIFLAAPKERRMCLPNTRFMIHQPSGGAGGQATDIAIQAKEIVKTRERIAKTVADATGKPFAQVLADMERDYWMSPQEAIAYGIASKVISSKSELS